MIDIHCHILPGIDDGPGYLDISLDMAATAAADGIRAIIATPHTDGFRVNSDMVKRGVNRLNAELREARIKVQIFTGYEIPSHLYPSLARTHTLAESHYFLLEFPHTHLPADALLLISQAAAQGLYPVIAHPERNPDIIARPELLQDLVAAGAMTQITAASVIGEIGVDVQQCAHYFLKNNLVHFIATDSHSPSFRRPVLSEARKVVRKLLGREEADRLVSHNGLKIIQHYQKAAL